MTLSSTFSRIKKSLCHAGRRVKRFLTCSDKDTAMSLPEKREAPGPVPETPSEATLCSKYNALPIIEPSMDAPPLLSSSTTNFRILDDTRKCSCRPLLLEKLRQVMANSLMPVLEEFKSCRCRHGLCCDSLTDVSQPSGYETMSTASLLLAPRAGTQFSYPNVYQNDSLAPCEQEGHFPFGPLGPETVPEPANEKALIVNISHDWAAYPDKDMDEKHNLCRCSSCFEHRREEEYVDSVLAWIDALPDAVVTRFSNTSARPRQLRRKRKMSNLNRPRN
ncbi:hypothetical protein PRK78_001639 [Emydomyces testavorans]|uniref:Uncharacterized protein n=1 Tax=Emydomyces testavorans TaxID=2070801 RepID=A0AAF0IGV8_9EURO|nr:hypothetical protein PRK78_001639 [Emydomyces testavorans]